MKISICLLSVLLGLAGCAATSSHEGPRANFAAMGAWTRRQGGVVIDERLERVRAIGGGLAGSVPGGVRFHILQNRGLSAYSWPGGEIFLSAGLVDGTSDDEIAAALAHEMGHLMEDGRGSGAVGLRGLEAPLELEERADRAGSALLRAAGRPTGALVTLLEKVSAASASASCRGEIAARIRRLQAENR